MSNQIQHMNNVKNIDAKRVADNNSKVKAKKGNHQINSRRLAYVVDDEQVLLQGVLLAFRALCAVEDLTKQRRSP